MATHPGGYSSRCFLHAASTLSGWKCFGSGSGIGSVVATLGGLTGGDGADALGGKVFKPGRERSWMPMFASSVSSSSGSVLLDDRVLLADGDGPAGFGASATFGHVLRYLLSFSLPPSSVSRSSSSSAWLTASLASELFTASESSDGSDPSDLSDPSDPSGIEQNSLEVEKKPGVGQMYCGCGGGSCGCQK